MLGFPQHWLAGGHVQAGGGKPSPNPAAHCKLPDAVPLEAGAAPGAVGGALLLAARACSFPNLPLAGEWDRSRVPLPQGGTCSARRWHQEPLAWAQWAPCNLHIAHPPWNVSCMLAGMSSCHRTHPLLKTTSEMWYSQMLFLIRVSAWHGCEGEAYEWLAFRALGSPAVWWGFNQDSTAWEKKCLSLTSKQWLKIVRTVSIGRFYEQAHCTTQSSVIWKWIQTCFMLNIGKQWHKLSLKLKVLTKDWTFQSVLQGISIMEGD